eukprot:768639-Hanusia_phi.AAC.2
MGAAGGSVIEVPVVMSHVIARSRRREEGRGVERERSIREGGERRGEERRERGERRGEREGRGEERERGVREGGERRERGA